MAVVTREDVSRIACLARLSLEGDEVDQFTSQLNRILEHVARLSSVDTSLTSPPGAETVARTRMESAPLREDEPRKGLTPAEALEPAPASERGLFKVPRIID